MNCARFRLNAETTTILVRNGWLIVEVAEVDALEKALADQRGGRLLTVAEVSHRTGFTVGGVRDWIRRAILPAVKLGREFRVREADLEKLIAGQLPASLPLSKRIGRKRMTVT